FCDFLIHLRDPRNLWLLQTSLFEIDQVGNGLDVGAIGNFVPLFSFFQQGAGKITPAKLGNKTIPDQQIAFVEWASFLETPFHDFLVAAALLHPFAQIAVTHPEKVATDGVSRSRRPEIYVIF